VSDLLQKKDELGNQAEITELFDLSNVQDRQIADLSGGELQRFACAMVCIQKGDIFMFDEPSSYLDVKQRLKAAMAIRNIIRQNRLVFLHILKILPVLND
jgi:ATP-binding cassette subfamily E protein 1